MNSERPPNNAVLLRLSRLANIDPDDRAVSKIAKVLKVSTQRVFNWTKRGSIPAPMARKFAKHYRCALEEVLGDAPSPIQLIRPRSARNILATDRRPWPEDDLRSRIVACDEREIGELNTVLAQTLDRIENKRKGGSAGRPSPK